MDHKQVSDAYIRRTITLLRVAEGDANNMSIRLKKIHVRMKTKIERTFKKPTRKTVKQLQVSINKELTSFYTTEWPDELFNISSEVIAKEITWNQNFISSATGESVIVGRSIALVKSAEKRTYQGKTFKQWVKKSFSSHSKRVNQALKTGFLEGKSISQLTTDMRGILGRGEVDVRTITRSFFMHNATEAKESVYKLNPDLVETKIWVSTLDSRTTPLICGIRDQMFYSENNEPIGHSFPWSGGPGRIHWNCRSTSIPKLKGIDAPMSRPSIGAGKNYERGDNKTRTGRVRKPNKAAREKGLYKTQMRTNRTRYEGWLKSQSKTNIDFVSDILGSKEKAKLFRDGKITLAKLSATSPVANTLTRKSL